jgi:hypothetical protein
MRAYRSRRRRCAAVYLLELNTDEIGNLIGIGALDPREADKPDKVAVAAGRVIRAIDPRPINMKG